MEEPREDLSDLVTVSVQWDPVKANLLRTLLESHGIFVHLWGEHLATANMFLSNAGGGTRLQVPGDQVSQARELIGAFERGELAVTDLSDESEADTAPTTRSIPDMPPSNGYSPPANPYIPSPATIATPPPAPAGPLRKVGLLIGSSAIFVALWFIFTH
jgi:hypothetical protein